ncbi:ferredoxin [Neomicrococcus aestuarii]|uniref:Ferredoxin n=2 Tax=Neomicrococcus aestuarii TaxID=556325 RepID=A0A7W8TTY2_9MICC|nr:2Fe-2S iron-sulfur cluster-binding protein [Neomicrococcus aestuarii]MBB5511978.1 ferredoxin [Neomicrococcus aestuarii]
MSSVLRLAEEMGWPTERLHSEHFEADVQGPGKNFQVTLAQSGQTITVPGTKSLLEALEGIGISVPNMCRKGVCGECAVPVLKGRVEHRDLYLTDEEKALHETVMCCVSRAQEQELELDL